MEEPKFVRAAIITFFAFTLFVSYQINAMSKEIRNLDRKFTNLDSKFTNLDSKFTNLDNKFANLGRNFTRFEEYTKRKLNKIKKKISKLSAVKAKKISKKTSCSIELTRDNGKVIRGSGNVVVIGDMIYVATNRHVVFDKGHFFKLDQIICSGRKLEMEGTEILIFDETEYDLALIPLKMDDYLLAIAAEVSFESPREAERIYGTNYHKGEHIYGECSVLSVKNLRHGIYPIITTNCPGKAHYSGTGYFNGDGFLVAIHKAGINLYDEKITVETENSFDELSEDQIEKIYKDFAEKCNIVNYTYENIIPCEMAYQDELLVKDIYKYIYKGISDNNSILTPKAFENIALKDEFFKKRYNINKITFKDIDHHSGIMARNPRSYLVDAHHLHSLILRYKSKNR